MVKRKLTIKQDKFCLYYLQTGNASEAYRLAYNTSNMKPKSVTRCANGLMGNVNIISTLKELSERVTKEAVVDSAYVLKRLIEVDQMDIADIINDDWTLKPLTVWPKVWRTYLSGFDVQEVMAGQDNVDVAVAFLKKIKWPDKLKNLELLGKHKAINAFKGDFEGTNILMPTRIELVAPDHITNDAVIPDGRIASE